MTETERTEAGSGTVLSLAVVIAMVISLLGMFAIAEALLARDRTQDVADLASLAGAEQLRLSGEGQACSAAGDLVARHNLDMVACEAEGGHLSVTVEGKPKAIPMTVTSRAQAGPANEPPASNGRAP
ncbi:MAG: Rv3654c family TadE-like protein [Ancrocorticia sp.]|uniref:Rv3654c family TadE-like protein n=1 Tax=Ancrocorticia sp. TaxID=2593684 RepID=UPI003F906C19